VVKQCIKLYISHNFLGVPFSISLGDLHILHPASLEPIGDEEGTFSGRVMGEFMVKEVDVQGGTGRVLQERPGTNRVIPWDWYVDKTGRNKVI
jgi:hypothetical protein